MTLRVDTTVHQEPLSEEFNALELAEIQMAEFEQSFQEHLKQTNVHSVGEGTMSALGLIQKELEDARQQGIYADFFEFTRKYYEAIEGLDNVEIKRTTGGNGDVYLLLNYVPQLDISDPESKALLTSLAFSELTFRVGDGPAGLPEETDDWRRICPENEKEDFIASINVNLKRYNTHFLGNQGVTMMSQFHELAKQVGDAGNLARCDIRKVTSESSDVNSSWLFGFSYRKFCEVLKTTVYCSTQLSVLGYCFIAKTVTN